MTTSALTWRACDNCGRRMTPFFPRKRGSDGEKMLCPMCALNQPHTAAEQDQGEVQNRYPQWTPESQGYQPGRLQPHEERQPQQPKPSPRPRRPGVPGSWPYNPDKAEEGNIVGFDPFDKERWGQNHVPFHTNSSLSLVAVSTDGRIQVLAHDSGTSEVIYHCPFCFTESTRYITESGIKTFGETVGTVQRVLTSDRDQREAGRWVEAHIHEFGEQSVMKVTLQRNQRTKVIEATPEHRWLVKAKLMRREAAPRVSRKGKPRDWRPTECVRGHLLENDNVRLRSNGTRECKKCAALATPVGGTARSTDRDVVTRDLKKGDRLSYLRMSGVGDLIPDEDGIRHGIVFGDGSAQGKYAIVDLWGEKDKQLLRYFPDRKYRNVTTANRVLGTGVPGVHVSGALWSWMKAVPESDDPGYLYGWLAGYFAADGTVSKQGQVIINSANLAHLEAVRDIALGLGITTYDITKKMRVGFPGREPSALYGLEFVGSTLNEGFFLTEAHRDRYRLRNYRYERIGWTVAAVEDTGRTEKVYCAVVPGTHSFALEGNIWVGNCGSGQVIARSDGTVMCEFCSSAFTVQVQPEFSAFPQTIDGQPVDIPGMPAGSNQDAGMSGMDPNADPDANPFADDSDPADSEEDGPPEDGDDTEDEPIDSGGNPLFNKKSYRTSKGARLTELDYIRHLALQVASDRDGVLNRIRLERIAGD